MKIFIPIFIIIFFISCSERIDELEILAKENQELKEQIEKLKGEIKEYELRPIVIPKSSLVEIGDDFESIIGMTISRKTSSLNVVFGNFINGEFRASTETQSEPFDNYVLFRQKSSKLGKHEYGGKIEFTFLDSTSVSYFQGDYDVINKK